MHRRVGKEETPAAVGSKPGNIAEAASKLLELCPGCKDALRQRQGSPNLDAGVERKHGKVMRPHTDAAGLIEHAVIECEPSHAEVVHVLKLSVGRVRLNGIQFRQHVARDPIHEQVCEEHVMRVFQNSTEKPSAPAGFSSVCSAYTVQFDAWWNCVSWCMWCSHDIW